MASYSKSTNFLAKDSLALNDPGKFVKGSDLDTEFNNLATADADSVKITSLGTGVATFLVTPSSANLAAAVTNETGSGALVFATSPTLVTPTLGVATATTVNGNTVSTGTGTLTLGAGSTLATSATNSITLTSTGATNVTLPTTGTLATLAGAESLTNKKLGSLTSNGLVTTSSGDGTLSVTVPGTGVLTALGVNVGTAGAFVVNGGALGSPSSGTLNAAFAVGGTWTAAATWTLPALTLGGAVTGNGQNISGLGAIGGTSLNIGTGALTAGSVVAGTGANNKINITIDGANTFQIINNALTPDGTNFALEQNNTGSTYLNSASGKNTYCMVGSSVIGNFSSTGLAVTGIVTPEADNTRTLGTGALRWSVVYAGTGTINTSDAREKTAVRELTADEINASKQLSKEIGAYQWLSAVATKGESAREHIGLTVQRAIQIMEANSLDPFNYGFICYDQWEDKFTEHPAIESVEAVEAVEATFDDEGNELTPAIAAVEAVEGKDAWTEQTQTAGDRYSFRMDELNLFIARGLEARLAALESA